MDKCRGPRQRRRIDSRSEDEDHESAPARQPTVHGCEHFEKAENQQHDFEDSLAVDEMPGTWQQCDPLQKLVRQSGMAPAVNPRLNLTEQSDPREQVFRVRGLTKVYGMGTAEVRALSGVDLDLYAGELVVLLGPSGSGKTTLLNNLGGLDVPTAGELCYRTVDLTRANDAELTLYRRNTVGFIFQFYNLIPSLTARENVGLITEIARDPMPPETALEMVNLGGRLDHFPAQLSGGEQQRVAIARAIAKRPEVLLCDEPTGALDVRTGIVVLEAIQRVNQELGTLTVVITHNAVMAEMADRVVHLSDGRVHDVRINSKRAPVTSLNW
jgi:putative ABC transport system ATP-binding protein